MPRSSTLLSNVFVADHQAASLPLAAVLLLGFSSPSLCHFYMLTVRCWTMESNLLQSLPLLNVTLKSGFV